MNRARKHMLVGIGVPLASAFVGLCLLIFYLASCDELLSPPSDVLRYPQFAAFIPEGGAPVSAARLNVDTNDYDFEVRLPQAAPEAYFAAVREGLVLQGWSEAQREAQDVYSTRRSYFVGPIPSAETARIEFVGPRKIHVAIR